MQSQIAANESVSEETVGGMAAKIGFVVGVDEENCAHIHYPAQDTVKVYDVGPGYEVGDYLADVDADHVECLEGTNTGLKGWMQYVALERGWELTTHRAPECDDGEWTDGGEQ